MATLLRMPGVSADATEVALVEWLIEPGGSLSAGDPIAVVETEKANVDIPVDDDVLLWRVFAQAGESVEVGSPIAVLLAKGESESAGEALLVSLGLAGPATSNIPEPAEIPVTAPAVPAPADAAPVNDAQTAYEPAEDVGPPTVTQPPTGNARIFATPLVRRLAQAATVSLDGIRGTGPNGRIVRADLEAHLAAASAAPEAARTDEPAQEAAQVQEAPVAVSAVAPSRDAEAGYTDLPHTRLRRAIASALVSSKQQAPHFYLTATLRVDDLLSLRAQVNARSSTRISINDLLVKAAALAFREVPDANVNWTPDAVRRFDRVDISVAIGSERGLVTPVIRGADRLSVSEIATRVRDFVVRADGGRLKQDEIVGGCFTISNLGMHGVEEFSAIINPPQVGILAVGAVVRRPMVVEDRIEPAQTITVTASFDHRPIDGVLAAKWLAAFTAAVETPLTILV